MNTDYIDSYYSRTRADDTRRPALDGAIEAETCVIGGGLAGLATALALAEKGRSVVLIEARRVGWGASGRNGGFVSPGYSLGLDGIERKLGADAARTLYRLSLDAHALVRRRADGAGVRREAGLLKCHLAEHGDGLATYVAHMNQVYGLRLEHWPRARMAEALATDRYADGAYNPDAFRVHPLDLSRGLARLAEGKRVRIFEGTPATGLGRDLGHRLVFTPNGRVRARHVVLACGGYVGGLDFRVSAATIPVATYVAVTEPLGDRLKQTIRVSTGVSDVRLANDYYRPLLDTRILWGGRISVFHPDAERLKEIIRADMLKVYPQLADVRMEVAWGGWMGYARHKMPCIAELDDGLWHNTCFGGHGLVATTVGGELVASAIMHGDDRWRMLEPFGLAFAGGPVGKIPAQMVYWSLAAGDWLRRRRYEARAA
ncbi:MAG: FAD-binding oxidoreductase [Alphaproteobacteria bacterium]|nr:FAD-binding oxidoreductase [Alphaproteobacteria bacterium]